MEEEVCLYQKYGFCKYKEMCSKRHLDQECKDLNDCKTKKICDKRHPKICKRYVLEKSCVFGDKCEYLHKENEMETDQIKTKERVDKLEQIVKDKISEEKKMKHAIQELEKVLKAMSRKVIHLEEQVVKMKEDSKENKKNELKEPFETASDFLNSTPVSANEKPSVVETKSKESKKYKFKCEKCEYKCQKESVLRKHTETKHVDQGYKEKPINSNNLQDSDKVKLDKRQEKEELSLTQRVKDVNKSFVFSESMLDEFL